MSHWVCDSGSTTNPQHSGHTLRYTGSWPQDIGAVEGSPEWSDPPLVHGSFRRSFALGALVEVAGVDDGAELHAQVGDEQQQRDANRPPLGALVVDVSLGDRKIGARRVPRPAEHACGNHAFDGPRRVPEHARELDRGAREVARKSVLDEEYGAMMLGEHMEVLRQGTVSDDTRPFLYANHMPRATEVNGQRARARPSCAARILISVEVRNDCVCLRAAGEPRCNQPLAAGSSALIIAVIGRRILSITITFGIEPRESGSR